MSTARQNSSDVRSVGISHRDAPPLRRRRGVLRPRGGPTTAGIARGPRRDRGASRRLRRHRRRAGATDDDDGEGKDGADGSAGAEDLFTGTWGFGHDTKALDAEQLADPIEQEAEARGPA